MRIRAFEVGELTYRCRDIGYGVEEGTVGAYWTGEQDTWGKLTFAIADEHTLEMRDSNRRDVFGGRELYLFPDEIVWRPFAGAVWSGEEQGR